jgi:hypothetical protein
MDTFNIASAQSVVGKTYGVPNFIWSCGDDFRKGFIDSTFSLCGTVDVQQCIVYITNSSEKFIRDLCDLVGFYGIACTVKIGDTVNVLVCDADLFSRTFSCCDIGKRVLLGLIPHKKHGMVGTVEVADCQSTGLCEDVWGITVYDDTNVFALSHCITGNCGGE